MSGLRTYPGLNKLLGNSGQRSMRSTFPDVWEKHGCSLQVLVPTAAAHHCGIRSGQEEGEKRVDGRKVTPHPVQELPIPHNSTNPRAAERETSADMPAGCHEMVLF